MTVLALGDRWLLKDSLAAAVEVIVEELPNGVASLYARTNVGWIPVGTAASLVHGTYTELERLPKTAPSGSVKFEWTEFKTATDEHGDFIMVSIHAEVDGKPYSCWLKRGEVSTLTDQNIIHVSV